MTSSGTSKEFNIADEKISSGSILSNILSNDANELKLSIDNYMETKLNEFQNIMKMKVGSFITDKLNDFYNKSFEGHDKVLFDSDGKDIIRQCNSYAQVELCNGAYKSNFQWYPLSSENNKCFILSCHNKHDIYIYDTIYIFNKYIIYVEGRKDGVFTRPQLNNHNLSSECLFSIKHFQAGNFGIGFYRSNPEYFNKNFSHFEEICKKEYDEIEKQKNKLQVLIDANLSKQEYYTSLENKIKELEIQNQELERELIKLKDQDEKNIEIEKQKIE